MKSFYIITNEIKDPKLEYTNRIVHFLQDENNCRVTLGHTEEKDGVFYTDTEAIPEDAECVLVLGGDGTLLQAARDIYFRNIPLIGINLGTVGYLAEIDKTQIEDALQKLVNDTFFVEERMMLDGVVSGTVKASGKALNDVVITRKGPLQINRYDIYVNDCLLYSCQADGIIVSTPTGASGYNMSAGGPIVSPVANLILLTPICPHSINHRSIVLAPDDCVKIVLPDIDERPQNAEAHFDGKDSVTLHNGDSVSICKAKETAKIIKLNQESFITVLQKKMKNN